MADKRCKSCGGTYPLSFFRKRSRPYAHGLSPACKACEQTQRDAGKLRNRWKVKARSAIRHHARRLTQQGKIEDFNELGGVFGWKVDQLAHDFEHAYKNGCPFCGDPFSEMPNGLSDVSIDILDRSRKPFYRTNTKIACLTCNRKKGDMSPDEFEEHRMCWERWLIIQEEIKTNPPPKQLTLQFIG